MKMAAEYQLPFYFTGGDYYQGKKRL